jgi:hypothetical protein
MASKEALVYDTNYTNTDGYKHGMRAMTRPREEAEHFLETCGLAVLHLYKQIPDLRRERERLANRIKDLEEHCKRVRSNAFVSIPYDPDDPDQPTAYQKIVWAPLKDHESELQELERKRARFLVELGATEESSTALAGAVLQIAKQVLSYRFMGKPGNLNGEKMIGSQCITEVIWEGRNHALHYETGSPYLRVKQMLKTLGDDFNITFDSDQNNSLAILDLLGWKDATAVLSDLHALIRSE